MTAAICRFTDHRHRGGQVRYGVLDENNGTIAILDGWDDHNALAKDWTNPKPIGETVDRPSELLPPVPPPEKILCIGLNYRDHAIETGAAIPDQPVVFSKFNSALVGDGQNIVLPSISNQVDFEAELVVVIGKPGKRIDPSKALDHVLGYTAGHDVSARDWQKGRPGGQWLLGKTFDTFAPLGPAVVAAPSFGDPGNVRVAMTINGQSMQDGSTDQLIFDIATLISHLSTIVTLRPGDLIFTGTPPGVGAARRPQRFLAAGDVCEVSVANIPTLCNRCTSDEV